MHGEVVDGSNLILKVDVGLEVGLLVLSFDQGLNLSSTNCC